MSGVNISGMRIALVAHGNPLSPATNSGVPYYLGRALQRSDNVDRLWVINSRPNPVAVKLVQAAAIASGPRTARPRARHGALMSQARSARRDRQLAAIRSQMGPDGLVLHVRSWYHPLPTLYACYIDATSEMLQGQSDEWTAPGRTHERRLAIEGAMYRNAVRVLCASEEAAASAVDGYGVADSRVRIVGNGLNFESLPDVRGRCGSDELRVLFVGRDPKRKGFGSVVEAVERLRAAGKAITLTAVGIPRGFGMPTWVENLGSIGNRQHMLDVYRRHDVLCLPSHQESFGLAVVEAMACGLAVVVTDVGELPRIVRHGEDGFVVPRGDSGAFCDALAALERQRDIVSEMGLRAQVRARGMTWDGVASRIVDGLSPSS